MNLYKYISLLFATLTLTLFSCSDDWGSLSRPEFTEEGSLRIEFAVPDPVRVNTRAVDESAINSLDIFIYSEDGTGLIQYFSGVTVVNNTVTLNLKDAARNSKVVIYAVANVSGLTSNMSIDDLKETLLEKMPVGGNSEEGIDFSAGMPMIGFGNIDTSSSEATISLQRNVGKISVFSAVDDYEVTEFKIYRPADKGVLGSPFAETDNERFYDTPSQNLIRSKKETENAEAYLYPTKSATSSNPSSGAFIVVKVDQPDGKPACYYRLNLRKEDTAGKVVPVDIRPNWWYSVKITGFMTAGYESYEEAAKHPECDQFVMYAIHDHALDVLSMTTDGVHELGVTPEVTLRRKGDKAIVVVKCFDYFNPEPEENYWENNELTLSVSKNWLNVAYKGLHSTTGHVWNETERDDHNSSGDGDNKGLQFEFEVEIIDDIYDEEKGEIVFKWCGLERKVIVNFESATLLHDICDVKLIIHDNDSYTPYRINDYWTFVAGDGDSKAQEAEAPRLFGILPEKMIGGKRRTNGFHFPMPYGFTPWEYEYEIDFSKLENTEGVRISSIGVTVSNDFQGKVVWTPLGKTGKLTFTGGKSYDYLIGSITFNVSFVEGNIPDMNISANLYHTGFFNYEGDSKYVAEDDKGYYYYEVVPMGDGYWLDRNIGAKANLSYVDTAEEILSSQREAVGRYYTIINNVKLFDLPEFDENVCPPGYHVPNTTEWDAVRVNSNFVSQSVIINKVTYMTTFYKTGDSRIGNVYLQKSRFKNEHNIYSNGERYSMEPNAGDAGGGYYWSVTEAPAMEKEQMGNWLRALYLIGSVSSYNNASVTDHRMPVRCKAGTAAEATPAQESYISLNVHEATHVFLFDKTTKKPIFTFPGKAVGTTSSAIKWQHFYCSTNQSIEDLLMLFVKLEEDGRVTIYYRNGENFESTIEYDSTYLSEQYAWTIERGKFYDFCDVAHEREGNEKHNVRDKQPEDCITQGENEGGGGGGDSGDINRPNVDLSKYRFKPEYAHEQVVTTDVTYFNNWQGNNQSMAYNYDWSKLKAGMRIKIYTVNVFPVSQYPWSNYQLKIDTGNWNDGTVYGLNQTRKWANGSQADDGKGNQYDDAGNVNDTGYDIYVLDLELTDALINRFKNAQGMVVYGMDCVFLGITIDKSAITLKSGDFDWTGSLNVNWQNNRFLDLTSDSYDWKDVKVGTTLTITSRWTGQPQLQIRSANNFEPIPGIKDTYEIWNAPFISETITITFTQEMIDNIKAKGGLIIGGGDYTLTGVHLKI